MKHHITALVLTAVLGATVEAQAQRIEVSATLSPVFTGDPGMQAFDTSDPLQPRIGADLRVNVLRFAGFDLLPLLAYRFSATEGSLGSIDTRLELHDLAAGLRLQRELASFLSFFAEATAGLVIANMQATVWDAMSLRTKARDTERSWEAGGGIGLVVGPSRAYLERRGMKRFSFGGELSGGYQARGDLSFSPRLQDADENGLDTGPSTSWGAVDASGWYAQMAFTVRFL